MLRPFPPGKDFPTEPFALPSDYRLRVPSLLFNERRQACLGPLEGKGSMRVWQTASAGRPRSVTGIFFQRSDIAASTLATSREGFFFFFGFHCRFDSAVSTMAFTCTCVPNVT